VEPSDFSYAIMDVVKRSKSLKLFSRGREAVLEQYLANQEQIAKENQAREMAASGLELVEFAQ
jgi:hypothetical protein